jgi:hypothetical protein
MTMCYIHPMHSRFAFFFGYFWYLLFPGGRES